MRIRIPRPAGRRRNRSGYSLIEVLVASGIMMLGVSAAASLSLAMITQEEIGYRVSRGVTMVENAAVLYRMGMTASEALSLIPSDPNVTLSYVSGSWSQDTAGSVQLEGVTFRAVIETADAGVAWNPGDWTAGSSGANPSRTIEARVYRSGVDVVTGPSPGP